ncbi:restriction endonuclease subunit S, partial [Candidatus Bipolaricaulota bacterium]|nr:restriction endonuclease subunit S [Candidatus Bipolaricaulota bacterium]
VDRRIRRYIRAKQKLIKLLREQKQAIIHCAVTRGLDPDVPLKDSGIKWLGQVPEHWEVLRTKHVFREVDRRSTTGEETHLSMSQRLGLVPSDMVQSSLTSESYVGGKLCEAEDLVLNRLKAHLGVFALANEPGVISPDYSVFRRKRPANTSYFEQVLRSPACRRELRIRAKGIVEGFWRLYTDDFYDIRVPVPPVPEQDLIMQELSQAAADIDTTIARATQEIELLNEYRTRLIADVVTGKLDVREAAASLPDESQALDEIDSIADDEVESEMIEELEE